MGRFGNYLALTGALFVASGVGCIFLGRFSERQSERRSAVSRDDLRTLVDLADVDGDGELSVVEERLLTDRLAHYRSCSLSIEGIEAIMSSSYSLMPCTRVNIDQALRAYEDDRH